MFNMEIMPQPESKLGNDRTSLYPERVSAESYIEESLEEIDRLIRGEGVLELTDEDKDEVISYEANLESQYSPIYSSSLKTTTLDLHFLATEEGRRIWYEQTGIENLPATAQELLIFIHKHTEQIAAVEAERRKELSAAGNKYRERTNLDSLLTQVDDRGNLVSATMEVGEKITLILNPEVLAQKLDALVDLKTKLKDDYRACGNDQVSLARREIIDLYIHRINLSIVSLQADIRAIEEKAAILGRENLSEEERKIIKSRIAGRSREKRDRDTSRYDKYKFGADREYIDGERRQVGSELQKYAEEAGKRWLESVLSIREKTSNAGLDYEKLSSAEIDPENRKIIVEGHLRALGVFQEAPEEIDEERSAQEKPEKCHARIKKGVRTASFNPRKRSVSIPDKPASIITALSVEAGHEVGHALQTINGSRIPLKIFENIGGGGDSAFSEGGAIAVQAHITRELFGYTATSHPHYIRAMVARQNGADYPETVRVFYQSAIEPHQILLERGQIDRQEFDKQVRSALELAINRCQRLFRGGQHSSDTGYLLSSKGTAYLDQLILSEKLTERGQEKLLLVRGMSFENIITLLRLGLLKTEDILEPSYEYIRSVWDQEKPKYVLG